MSLPPILIIALAYPPDPYSGSARPYRFAKYLGRLGHTVRIIAGGTSDECVVDGNLYRVHADYEDLPSTSFIERVFRKFLLHHDEGIAWSPRVVEVAKQWRAEPMVMLSTSPPFTTHVAALWAKKRFGWPWIADFRDPLVGNPYRHERAHKMDGVIERLIFRNADAMIANTDKVAEMWRKCYPEHVAKIHTIWNGFDPEDPLEALTLPARSFRTLRHAGTVYGDRYPTQLFESLARLSPSALSVELIGLLSVPPGTVLFSAPWLHTRSKVPKVEADRLISESDYLLLLDVTTSNIGLQVPAKMFDYIRIGRPILARTVPGSPVDRILAQSGVPNASLYADEPEAETDAKVAGFLTLPADAVTPSAWFRENFDGLAQARILSELVQSLSKRR